MKMVREKEEASYITEINGVRGAEINRGSIRKLEPDFSEHKERWKTKQMKMESEKEEESHTKERRGGRKRQRERRRHKEISTRLLYI